MSCCKGGIYRPLILDPCTGKTRSLADGERLRIGGELIGGTPGAVRKIYTDETLYDEAIIFADASAASLTVTLPEGMEGMTVAVKKIDATGNTVTIDAHGSETIDGQLTLVISAQYVTATLRFHDGEWWIM
ncbi:MAG: hypothetical protein ACYSW8_27820 [Planctomycetota bacterium]|jgi:hypothetical protein